MLSYPDEFERLYRNSWARYTGKMLILCKLCGCVLDQICLTQLLRCMSLHDFDKLCQTFNFVETFAHPSCCVAWVCMSLTNFQLCGNICSPQLLRCMNLHEFDKLSKTLWQHLLTAVAGKFERSTRAIWAFCSLWWAVCWQQTYTDRKRKIFSKPNPNIKCVFCWQLTTEKTIQP